MATTTPNYGWAVPTSTDLVKDGATAIETLGDAIDASMNTALGTKKAGMVLLNTTSFSGVSSQSINDVFSANYNVYKIMLDVSTSLATSDFSLRLRVGGADTSTSIYRWQYIAAGSTTINGVRSVNISSWSPIGRGESSRNSSNDISIYNPFETVPTTAVANWSDTNTGNIAVQSYWYGINDTVSYTGFTMICTSNMTGSISVYGFNQ
jgi:hypothetical protein